MMIPVYYPEVDALDWQRSVLVVEPEQATAQTLSFAIEEYGHSITLMSAPKTTLERIPNQCPNLVVIAANLQSDSGFAVCQLARKRTNCPIVTILDPTGQPH